MGERRLKSAITVLAPVLLAGAALAVAAPAHAFRGFVLTRSFGSQGSAEGSFSEAAGIAVNETSGDVYVADKGNNRIERFDSSGSFLSAFTGSEAPTGPIGEPVGVAVDNSAGPAHEDLYVTDAAHQVVDHFDREGHYSSQITGTPEAPFAHIIDVAVDPDGNVWVSQESGEIDEFSGVSNEFMSTRFNSFTFIPQAGLAVDSSEDLFVRGLAFIPGLFGTIISELDSSGNVVREDFEPKEASGVGVDAAGSVAYIDNFTEVKEFAIRGGERLTSFGAGEITQGGAIAANHSNGAVYVVDDGSDEVRSYGPEPPGSPTASGLEVSHVTSNSARLQAAVDPHGISTSYTFRVCTQSEQCKEAPLPPGILAASYENDVVSTVIADLSPDATYSYTVIARNASGEANAEQRFLHTQASGPPTGLVDGRTWERVSPPDKRGALIPGLGNGTVQASAAGDAIAYLSNAAIGQEPQGIGEYSQILSKRSGSGVWTSTGLGTANDQPTGLRAGAGSEYRLFSPDLSLAVVEPPGGTLLSPLATEATPYIRDDAAGTYQPLATASNVTSGAAFGKHIEFLTATPDFRSLVLFATVPLYPGAPPTGLYVWSQGRFTLLSVLPNGSAAPAPFLGLANRTMTNTVSTSGTKFLWSEEGEEGHLYYRDLSEPVSRQIDTQHGGVASTPSARYEAASSDLSRVFFRDEERLRSNASQAGDDLYVFDAADGEVTDLSHSLNTSERADVLGTAAVSEDGTYAYFVADGALSQGAVAGTCRETAAGRCNLYVEHLGAAGWEVPRTIAILGGADEADWEAVLRSRTSRVSSSGRFFTFMASESLTGEDMRDSHSAVNDAQVFLFDANAADSGSRLRCVSCNPSGTRPEGVLDSLSSDFGQGLRVDEGGAWNNRWLAGSIPSWTSQSVTRALYQARYLNDSGRLFFQSADRLVSADTNSSEDVYEFEPSGVGSCRDASGCVALMSSGTASEEAVLLDASGSGDDVFFTTSARLADDTDTATDVYDAHVCSEQAPCRMAAPAGAGSSCESAGTCRGAAATVAPPAIEFPPSGGALPAEGGNVKPVVKHTAPKVTKQRKKPKKCAKRRHHKRTRCVKAKKRQRKGR
jgi:hypothetical protein